METHSLGAAVARGCWRCWPGRANRGKHPRLALAVTLAWSTHVLFDWLGSDDTPPLGVMALWPLSSTFYFADAYCLRGDLAALLAAELLDAQPLAVAKEIVILAPLAALAWGSERFGGVES